MTSRAATIYDVAALAGVGRTTVSRVLNGEARVSAATRAHVLDAVHQLRYRANAQARLLAGGRSHFVNLVYPVNDEIGPVNWYNLLIESGALRGCAKAGLLLQMNQVFPHSLKAHDRILEPIDGRACDGIILAPPFSDDAELIRLIRARHVPVSLLAAGPETRALAPGVGIDDEAAGYDLTRYLIGLGHRRFAFIHGLRDHISAGQRYEGFRRALSESGVPESAVITFRGNLNFSTGFEHLQSALDSGHGATVVVCANDDMAAGALYRAHKAGLRVPEDLTVVGFDDAPFSAMIWPPLTTIAQPIFTMAQKAVEIILGQIENPDRLGTLPYTLVPHRLIIRESAAGPSI